MPTQPATEVAQLTINVLRGLAMDAVQQANSGHPGMPMGAAAMGYAIFARHLRFDPEAPAWFNRDRFILSAGHGSMLLYGLLHLTGYDLPLDEIRRFRQWESKTPGHPENFLTPGVEMATGPLGQGFATGVGMAIAEAKLRAEFPELVDHWTYAICSDGDLMEGVASEAASLAGHLKLGRIIYLYDSNRITIDGSTDLAFTEDVAKRFESYGWHVSHCDGMSLDEVDAAISDAKAVADKPSLIICRTVIGFGSPNKANSASSHGAALGEEEVQKSKAALGLPVDEKFWIPEEVRAHMRTVGERHRSDRIASELAASLNPEFMRRISGHLPQLLFDGMPPFEGSMATRQASGKVINLIASKMPELIGGSADLAESNNTLIADGRAFSADDRTARNIYFGVREHAMGCIVNGINLHGGIRAFGGTFLIFSDYMRPSIRLSALMHVPSIFVFTHDSIGLGEDGPTHQPVEHLPSLRAIPRLRVFRPADGNETISAWRAALTSEDAPTAIVLTRQKLPAITPPDDSALRGGYILSDGTKKPDVILIGAGSELSLCLQAQALLSQEGIAARVVSMPCCELFDDQAEDYRTTVLPPEIEARVAVEAAAPLGWHKYVGLRGTVIGLERFGASAPAEVLFEKFGFTAERAAEAARIAFQNCQN